MCYFGCYVYDVTAFVYYYVGVKWKLLLKLVNNNDNIVIKIINKVIIKIKLLSDLD